MIVEEIEAMHREEGVSYRDLCDRERISYASFMRWRKRVIAGDDPVSRPGPDKVEPLDLKALCEEIRTLGHGTRRSAGSGALHSSYGKSISRRDLNQMIREERERKKKERNRIFHQVRWKVPRLIWAMDDSEYHPDKRYPKAYLHTVQDLGSRYKLAPLVGIRQANGEQVAANLDRLFKDHGAPLFLKRDNGSNLNHHLVNELLGKHLVIPVNSPVYYPQYNGGIERGQGIIKACLREHDELPNGFLGIQAEIDIQTLNHRRRSNLGHRTPCAVFAAGLAEARKFTKRKRREVYDWIKEKALDLRADQAYTGDKAWRLAVETWLLEHRFITVSKRK